MKKKCNRSPFSAVPKLTGCSLPQTRWLTGRPGRAPPPHAQAATCSAGPAPPPPIPAQRPGVRPPRAAPGRSGAAPPRPAPRPPSPERRRLPGRSRNPDLTHPLPPAALSGPAALPAPAASTAPPARPGPGMAPAPPGRTFPPARPECASAITVPRSALAAAPGPRRTPGRSPAIPWRPPGGTCGPVPRGRGPRTTQLRSLARPRRSRCLRHTRCAHGPTAHPAPPLCARLAGAASANGSGAAPRAANGSGGRGHPTAAAGGWAERASRAPGGGGRGEHGGAGFAVFARDSPPAPARAVHSAARAQRSPGPAHTRAAGGKVGALARLSPRLSLPGPARPVLAP